MSGSPLFLEYQLAKAQTRAATLEPRSEEEVKNMPRGSGNLLEEGRVWLKETNADALTWVDSLVDPEAKAYTQRRHLAHGINEALDGQEADLDGIIGKTSGVKNRASLVLMRLRFRFAGLSAFPLLPGRNTVLFLGVVLSLTLMVTSLAVMSQAGMLVAGTWVLGNTLTSTALWLAAQLSITTLGFPGLIALVTLGAWLAAALIVEWKFRGTIENAFFGLTDEGAEKTGVYSNCDAPDLIGKIENGVKYRLKWNLFAYPYLILKWFNTFLFNLDDKEPLQPSSRPFVFIKGLVHFILAALAVPFMALAIIADSFALALRLIWNFPYLFGVAKVARLGVVDDNALTFLERQALDGSWEARFTEATASSPGNELYYWHPAGLTLRPRELTTEILANPAAEKSRRDIAALPQIEQRALREGWERKMTLPTASPPNYPYYLHLATGLALLPNQLTEAILRDPAAEKKRQEAATAAQKAREAAEEQRRGALSYASKTLCCQWQEEKIDKGNGTFSYQYTNKDGVVRCYDNPFELAQTQYKRDALSDQKGVVVFWYFDDQKKTNLVWGIPKPEPESAPATTPPPAIQTPVNNGTSSSPPEAEAGPKEKAPKSADNPTPSAELKAPLAPPAPVAQSEKAKVTNEGLLARAVAAGWKQETEHGDDLYDFSYIYSNPITGEKVAAKDLTEEMVKATEAAAASAHV